MVLHRVSVAAAAAAVAVAAVVLFAGGGNLAEAAYTKCGPMLRPLLPNDKVRMNRWR